MSANCCVASSPQRPKETLSMSLTSHSRPPVPRLRTSLPFAIKVRVVPDTQPASSRAPVPATSVAVETPSTAWSRGTVCAAVDWRHSRATRSSAAPNKLWVSERVCGRNWDHNPKTGSLIVLVRYISVWIKYNSLLHIYKYTTHGYNFIYFTILLPATPSTNTHRTGTFLLSFDISFFCRVFYINKGLNVSFSSCTYSFLKIPSVIIHIWKDSHRWDSL